MSGVVIKNFIMRVGDFSFFESTSSLLKHTYVEYFKYPQKKIGTFMVIDPMVNRAHHGGACSSSSLDKK